MTKSDPDRTAVAQDLFTWCTKEKTETWHVVRNHDASGIVDRVICKACGSEHKYRRKILTMRERPAGARVVVRSGGASESPAMSSKMLEETWLAGLKKWGEKPVKAFEVTMHFAIGEVLNHAVFGKGVVQTRRENKIDVLFQNGQMKTLPSATKPSLEG